MSSNQVPANQKPYSPFRKFETAKTVSKLRRGLLLGLALLCVLPLASQAALITSAGDAALSGADVQNFDSFAPGFFTSRDFLIGGEGFTVTPTSGSLHIDDQFCGSFSGGGSCLDTITTTNAANDDFDVVFTGSGVSAFGFAIDALDIDWTVTTYDASDNVLGTYVIASQSPGLTGFNRRGYFGATEALPIQYFTVRSAASDRALIDNFAYVTVPEPGPALLMVLGLMGLSRAGRSPGIA